MSPQDFHRTIARVTEQLSRRQFGDALADWLNTNWPSYGAAYRGLANACRAGVANGWPCNRKSAGIRYGPIGLGMPIPGATFDAHPAG